MPDRNVAPDPYPLVAPADAPLAATEAAHTVLARTLGAASGDRLAGNLARIATSIRPGKRRALEQLYRDMVGADPQMPLPETYITRLIETMLQQRMIYARLAAKPGWRPHLAVEGDDAVAAELARGRGAVLWLLPLEINAITARMACAARGWTLNFMSHWRHGPSTSRIGRHLINARDCRVESLFGPRLVMTDADTGTALAEAQRILRDGGLVGFRGIGWAKRPVCYPLFAGHMQLAFGAPATARKTGAALFIVGTARTDTGFRVCFEPVEGIAERPFEEIGAEFALRLERSAQAAPTLWSAKSRQWAPGPPPAGFTAIPHPS